MDTERCPARGVCLTGATSHRGPSRACKGAWPLLSPRGQQGLGGSRLSPYPPRRLWAVSDLSSTETK